MDYSSTLMHDSFDGMSVFPRLSDLLHPSAEGDGVSPTEVARRDLDSTLQLLAERAQYVMGASGAAIALRDGEEMICRASAGPTAPPLDTPLKMNSILAAESIRKRRALCCDDAEGDRRVDQEICRALKVKSVMVTPLLRKQEAVGVFELLAERTFAFEERDVTALERLSQMVLTALDQADAAREEGGTSSHNQDKDLRPRTSGRLKSAVAMDLSREVGQIQKCSGCGFPVSAGRSLCLDCEKNQNKETEAQSPEQVDEDSGLFLSAQFPEAAEHGWLASGMFVTAIMMTVVAILWLVFRIH